MVYLFRCVLCILFQQKKRPVCCKPLCYLVNVAIRYTFKVNHVCMYRKYSDFQSHLLFWRTVQELSCGLNELAIRWSEGLQGFFFFRKDYWQLVLLPPRQFRPSEKKGSSLVQDKLCWWINRGVFTPGLKLPRATSDGEKRDLPVPLGRARSSSWSLAWLVECSSVWELGTGLLMPEWCLIKYGLHFGNRE